MPDVRTGSTRVPCNTSAGVQQIDTPAEFGGATPKLVLLTLTKAIADGTATDGARLAMGATDGAAQMATATFSNHGVTTTNTKARYAKDVCIMCVLADGSVDGEASYDSFGPGYVRINWTNAPADGYFLTVDFFGGADFKGDALTLTNPSTTATQTVNTLTYEPDALIVISATLGGVQEDAVVAIHRLSVGFVHNASNGTVTQRSMLQKEQDGLGDGTPVSRMMEDAGAFAIAGSGTTVTANETVFSNFTSSGFDWQTSTANNPDWLVIALNFGGLASAVGTYEPPTSTGAHTLSLPWTPQFCLLGLNLCQAVDTSEQDADAGSFGLAHLTASAQYCDSISIEDAAATTNTQSLSDNQAINFPAHDGSALYTGTQTAMDSGGVDFTYTAVSANTRKWIYLAVEAPAAAAASPLLLEMQNYALTGGCL